MSLRETTQAILGADDPAEWLRLADMYIATFNQMPASFVLPAQHAVLKPAIVAFHHDPATFARYIEAIRDQFPPGDKKIGLHRLYRTVLTRVVQQDRRARMARALVAVEKMIGRPLTTDERERVIHKLEQHWAYRRMQFLKAARSSTAKGRLSSDERAEMLKQFWEEIDAEIERRELPMFRL